MNNQPPQKNFARGESFTRTRISSSQIILWAIVIILTVAITALTTFSFTVKTFFRTTDENAIKLQTITKLIEKKAYYDPDYEEMFDAALKAFVGASGDKYTVYYNAEEYAALTQEKQGHYVGIGVTTQEIAIEYLGRSISVLEVVRIAIDSAAAESDLKVGDYIYGVETADGIQYVDDIGKERAVEYIRGEAETSVKILWLTATGDSYTSKEAFLTCKQVSTISVTSRVSQLDPSVGIVSIYQFDLTTPSQLSSAFDSLKSKSISKVVLDLRDNGGGDLISVVACASYFTKNGDVIITAKSKDGSVDTQRSVRRVYSNEYASCNILDNDIGKYRDFKIAVLVNENTASAAELLTAVFRDYDLAPIIGVQTFGKGSMQTLISLAPYGLEGGIKITTSHYYPPCGEGYNGIGITPDITIACSDGFNIYAFDEKQDLQLSRAIEELNS